MKNIKKIYIILIAVVMLWGCSDWLDVNKNPNTIDELQAPEVVLPVAQVNIANALMGWDMGFAGGLWSQYWTQIHIASQFKFLDEYEETEFDRAYRNLLPYALNDLKKILTISEVESTEYFVAEVLSIYTWQIVTDTWGDVPYFDALKGDEGTFSPAFDSQELIYADLLARINILLDGDYEGDMNSDYDFIYEGDLNSWKEFAQSLKLKLMLRLSETSGYNNDDLLALVNEGGFISSSAMMPGSIWEDTDGKRHPMAEFEAAGYVSGNVIASQTFIAFLDSLSDPRIDVYFDAPSTGHKGSLQGDFESEEDTDGNGTPDQQETYSQPTFPTDTDIPLMSTWEVEFYIAEVYTRDGDNVNAKIHYDAGVQASFDYWGLTNNLTQPGGVFEWQNGTIEEGIEQISLMKWVAYCKLQHIEAFFERNRTKYPAVNMVDVELNRTEVYNNFPFGQFTLSVMGRAKLSEKLPQSPIYPNAVVTRNTTNPSQKANVGERVWWNQKAEIERP